MTRKSVIARDIKRQKTVERFAVKRAALKEAFLNPDNSYDCLLYTSPSPRDLSTSRMPSSA